ncbi:MAG TPA: FAD:protein FMN transferase [Solirubrobacteraceae bacterium]|nr:FAD:protein FMN transferase [Solirubrobacteraceae bacterium]
MSAATVTATLGQHAPPSRARWRALGTSAELLVSGDERALVQARVAVEGWLDAVDRACSRFRADSDLSRLNRAGGKSTVVSPLLIEATKLALRAARLSDGDVDPTLGAALELAGYDRDWSEIERQPQLAATSRPATASRPAATSRLAAASRSSRLAAASQPAVTPYLRVRLRPGWTRVLIDERGNAIRLPRGVKLDLGATAKAWAADRAARAACKASGCGVLVALGGDVATAGTAPADGWRVHVTDDHRHSPHAPGQTVAIRAGAIATSSTSVRRWRRGEQPMHHIIDPATGAPAQTPWRTVSVAAADCADANIAATAAIVRGERAVAWLAQAGLPARLVANDGEVLTVGDWPEQGAIA